VALAFRVFFPASSLPIPTVTVGVPPSLSDDDELVRSFAIVRDVPSVVSTHISRVLIRI
jgi:hypothetical protein